MRDKMNMQKTREILITNDDGVNSKGIKVLAQMMRKFGNVTIVAPNEMQSGKSAALSLETELYIKKVSVEPGLRVYSFNGTPVSCVKMAINEFFSERMPDLLVSGINHGSNASVASLYSGTLGACIEGTIYDIPSIGFSIDNHSEDPDLESVVYYGEIILRQVFASPFAKGVYLNVNFPNIPFSEIKGIKMARRGRGRWIKEYQIRLDDEGKECYWMSGHFENQEPPDGIGDHMLVKQNYITIVPHSIDTTDYQEICRLNQQWTILQK